MGSLNWCCRLRRVAGLELNTFNSIAGWGGIIALAMMPALTTPAGAQYTWQGADDAYNLNTNWSPTGGAPPVNPGQAAIFGSTGSTTVNVLSGPITPDSWTFSSNSQNFVITGQNVDFSGAGPNIINLASAIQSISIANNMTGATISQAGNSILTLSGMNAFATTNITLGQLTNSGTLTSVVTNSASFRNDGTQRGAVSNSGGVINFGVVNGGLTNSGNYSQFSGMTNGGTTNTATINANSGAFNGAISNDAGGAFNVNGTVTSNTTFDNSTATSRLMVNSGSYTVSGLITNSGTDVDGGVLVSVGATLNASGGLTNNAGATFVNNGTTNGAVNILGGSLHGIGTISGAVRIANGGTLASGNGTAGSSMTIGSLAFQSGAFYAVQVDPATSSSTTVTGTAKLGSATVNATFANGSYVAKQYTIVTAGNIDGNFSSTVANANLPSGFRTTLSYDATHAYLDLALSFAPPSGQLNGNQQNVGNAIVNFFNATGSIPIVFGGLTPAGLTQLSGEGATAPQQTTFNAMNQFMGVMTDPFVAGRGDPVSAGGGAAGYADEALSYAGKRKPNDALAAIYTKAPPAPPFAQRWSVWAAGFGGSQRIDGNTALGSNDTRSSMYGTAVGADYRLLPNTLAGFALAGGGTNFSVNGLGSGRSDLFQAGVFLRHNTGPAYLAGALAYGWQDVTTDRTVTVAGFDQLRAKFNAHAWSGRLEGGYRFVPQGFGFTPYAAGQFTTFDLPGYAEQVISGANTFALAYGGKAVTATRSELGLRADTSIAMQDRAFTLRGRLAWAHDYNTDRNVGASFQTLPGASFVVNGALQPRDLALTTASAEWRWLNGWTATATFEGEFSDISRSYAGKGVVRYVW